VANRELSKSENLLKEAQNIANLASWEWENKTGKFSGPELFLERFNVKTPSSMSGFNELAGIVHPDDRDLVLQKIEQLMASQRSIHVQFRLKVITSRKIFLEMRANSEFSSSGKLLRIYGVLMDKTSQVESENLKEQFTRELEDQVKDRTAMLEISQNELSHQVDTLNQIAIVSTIDTEGIITYANDIFCKVSGYSLPELIGKQFADLHSSSQDIASIISLWGGVEKGDIWKGVKEHVQTLNEKEKESLHKWFKRSGPSGKEGGWVDCNTGRKDPKTGKMKYKACGRKEGEKRA